MKRYAPLLLTAVLLCTACQDTANTSSTSEADTVQTTSAIAVDTSEPEQTEAAVDTQTLPALVESAEADETVEPMIQESAESSMSFEAGVWHTVVDGIPTGYYIMDEDGKSGRTLEFESGTGVGFSYEIGINEVMFHFGSEDNDVLYPITGGDPSYVFFQLPNGSTMEMSHDTALSADTLSFYSNMELCELALNYYTAQTGYTPTCAASVTNTDGTVTIQLYDSFEDHNSTSAWYTVDRFTASGTDDIMLGQVSFVE